MLSFNKILTDYFEIFGIDYVVKIDHWILYWGR